MIRRQKQNSKHNKNNYSNCRSASIALPHRKIYLLLIQFLLVASFHNANHAVETHRQSIIWQQTWLFDYCTRWHAAQHAIRFGCHCLSHLQIITINLVLSPLPDCRFWRKLLLEKKSSCRSLILQYIENWNSYINERKSRWSDIYNGRTKNWKIHRNVFVEEQEIEKYSFYITIIVPRGFITHYKYGDG